MLALVGAVGMANSRDHMENLAQVMVSEKDLVQIDESKENEKEAALEAKKDARDAANDSKKESKQGGGKKEALAQTKSKGKMGMKRRAGQGLAQTKAKGQMGAKRRPLQGLAQTQAKAKVGVKRTKLAQKN